MNRRRLLVRYSVKFVLGIAASLAMVPPSPAAQVNGVFAIDTANIIDLYSATFDGALNPNCAAAPDPDECEFFGGFPAAGRAITITGSPATDATGTLDVEYDDVTGEIIQINTLRINLPDQILNIQGTTFVEVVQGNGMPVANDTIFADAGINALPNMTADPDESALFDMNAGNPASGPDVFEHDDAPSSDVPDFATFSEIVDLCHDGSRVPNSGPLCGLILILTLDGVRYRVIGTVSAAGGDTFQLQTQTANNSIYKVDFATALVPVPEITVTDSVAPATDLTIPFGSVTEMTSANQTVTVTNDGTANLNIGNLATVDTLAAPFSLLNDMCSGQLLAPMASCTTTVVFAPTATGAFNDSFDIPSDDADEPSVTISLTGTGTAMPVPDINVTDSIAPADDASVPFGSVTINQSAPPATVTVTNSGNADLLLGQIAPLTAPFVIADNNCSNATVMPMMNCTLMVTFMPTVVGPANGTLTIPSNDPDSPNVAVAVSGTGAPLPTPDITVMDVAVAFGAVTINDSSTQTVVVTNDGTADLTIGTVAMADPLAAPFSVAMDGCSSQVLMPMDSCMIDLTFAPTATGAANDSLDIPSDDPDEASVTVNVSGTGSDPTVFQPVPDSPEGSDSGFFGSMDLISLFAMLLVVVGYRRTKWGLSRV